MYGLRENRHDADGADEGAVDGDEDEEDECADANEGEEEDEEVEEDVSEPSATRLVGGEGIDAEDEEGKDESDRLED